MARPYFPEARATSLGQQCVSSIDTMKGVGGNVPLPFSAACIQGQGEPSDVASPPILSYNACHVNAPTVILPRRCHGYRLTQEVCVMLGRLLNLAGCGNQAHDGK